MHTVKITCAHRIVTKTIHMLYSTSTLNSKEHSDSKLSQLKCVATLVLYNIHNNQRTGRTAAQLQKDTVSSNHPLRSQTARLCCALRALAFIFEAVC